MRTLYMAFLFCLTSSIADAQNAYQSNKPVICDSLKNVTSVMKEQYGEEPIWVGDDLQDTSKYVMLANFQTKTWTFVQFTKDWACVLGTGTGGSQLKVGNSV